ncbi:MAG: type II toxin-antitoxin system PemK/MazF family toxin [Actinobacteria bacterium]|nr:type II toxin-antitoxin system PemK/MazF family toxin [Actinomycetota bacterium]
MSPDDIWLVDFGDPYPGEPADSRPALVLGPSRLFPDNMPFVTVAPLTTTHRGLSLHVEIEPSHDNGLDSVSYIQCELIRSINRSRMVAQLGIAEQAACRDVATVVRTLLGY